MIEPSDPAEEIENAEATDPIEPIESADPIEPIERTEPRDPIESTESCDHSDHFELPPTPPGYGSFLPMIISTMNDLPGYRIDEVFGEVFGLTVRSRNLGSQIGAGF